MKILAFDPSMTCTGWALLEAVAGDSRGGKLLEHGYFAVDGETLVERVSHMQIMVVSILKRLPPDLVVVETPAETGRVRDAQNFRGTAMTTPIYGVAVGACIAACCGRMGSLDVLGVPSDEWTKGREVPKCGADSKKMARVEYVQRTWGVTLGPKSYAGNVADAVLIARWACWRHEK
jgi:hypothetical protein